jgi:hypothetical protein
MNASHKYLILLLLVAMSLVYCTKYTDGYNPQGGDLPSSFVQVFDSTFSPAFDTIALGGSVKFINQSSMAHTIVSDDNTTIPSVLINSSSFYLFKKDTVGVIHYHCVEHPNAAGAIVIRP